MGILILILFIALITPVVVSITGIVFLFNPATRKKGKHFLLAAVLIFLIEILIGYPMCSGIRIGGGH